MLLPRIQVGLACLYLSFLQFVVRASRSGVADWASLNTTVGGRLHITLPFELPCFSTFNGQPVSSDPSACKTIQENYTQAGFRIQHFGAYMNVRNLITDRSHYLMYISSLYGRHARKPEKVAYLTTPMCLIRLHSTGPIARRAIFRLIMCVESPAGFSREYV